MTEAIERPSFVNDAHLDFLDGLKDSGITNMLGSRSYLMEEFEELGEDEAKKVLSYWMETFGDSSR